MRRFLLYLGAAGLVASVVVHLLTFVPGLPITMRQVGVLQVIVFVPFFAMILRSKPFQRPGSGWGALELLRHVPPWLLAVAVSAFVYAMLNLALFSGDSSAGGPVERDGHSYRATHGRILAEISEDEYRHLQALEVRGFSGHWLVFYLLPVIFFGWVEPGARASSGVGGLPARRRSA